MKRRKILVTGGGGFIGSHLCEMLTRAGYKVRAFLHYNSRNYHGWLDHSPFKDKIEMVMGDIRDFDSVNNAVRGSDAICHLAALIGIPYSYNSPLAYIRTNVEGTYNVLEAARLQGKKRVVHTSTSETYGTAQYVPIDEKHPLVGQSPYSASKIGADQIALSYALSFDIPVTVLRPFNTYGPRQSLRAIVPTIISQLLAGKDMIELGNLAPTRDLTYVSDTCAAFIKAINTDAGMARVINLGTGRDISVRDLAEKIMKLMGCSARIVRRPERVRPDKSEVKRLKSDNSAARALLKWAPEMPLEEGLYRTIEFMRQNPGFYDMDGYVV